MTAIFYMARHGMTIDDTPENCRVTGWLDVPINREGRMNAHRAARRLKTCDITSIIASDSLRTHMSASIIGEDLGIPVAESERLRSWNMGALQGMDAEAAKPFMTHFQKNPSERVPKGEPFRQFYNRFKTAWDATVSHVRKFPSAHPLLVTHSQCMDIAYWFMRGQEPGRTLEFGEGIPPGGILEVRVDGDKISIRKLKV